MMERQIGMGRIARRRSPSALASASKAVLTGMGIACAVLTVFGSAMFRTRRVWDNGDGSVQSWSEGAARWAGLTFLCGLSALLVLLVTWWFGTTGHGRRAAVLSMIACGIFLVAASRAGENWRRLLAEREHPLDVQPSSDYVLTIAAGLPVVTVCATLGAIVAFGLTLVYFGPWLSGRSARTDAMVDQIYRYGER